MRLLLTSAPYLSSQRPDREQQEEVNQWYLRMRTPRVAYSRARKMVAPYMLRFLPESLFETHPEYFGMDDAGQRNVPSRNRRNPCTSNPKVIEFFQEQAVELLRKNPQAVYFGLEPIDGGNWCQCPDCRAMDVSPTNHSDRLVLLANHIHEAIQQAFPGQGKSVRFFAYQSYTFSPMRQKLRPGIQVEITHGQEPILQAWAEVSDNLQNWSYTGYSTFHWGPLPGVLAVKRNFDLLRQYGAHGIYYEGTMSVLNMAPPMGYIAGKLMWDPTADVPALLTDFFEKYYGPASEPMRQCFDLLEEQIWSGQTSGLHWLDHRAVAMRPLVYRPAIWRQCETLIEEALALAADHPVLLRRINTVKMTYLLAHVGYYAELAEQYLQQRDQRFWQSLPAVRQGLHDRLLEAVLLAKSLDIDRVRGNKEPSNLVNLVAQWGTLLELDTTAFAAVLLGQSARTATAQPGQWQLTFEDDFTGQALGESWVVVDGKYQIRQGALEGNGEIYINQPFAGDVRLEYEAWVDDQNAPCDLSALMGVDAIAARAYKHAYFFGFGNRGNVRTALLKDLSPILTLYAPLIEQGKRYHIVCQREGGVITWHINGKRLLRFTDFGPLDGPYVGFYLYTPGYVVNVKVYTKR